jgi:hypothetical protein
MRLKLVGAPSRFRCGVAGDSIPLRAASDEGEVFSRRHGIGGSEAMAVTDMAGAFPDPIGLKNRRCEKMSPFLADSQR